MTEDSPTIRNRSIFRIKARRQKTLSALTVRRRSLSQPEVDFSGIINELKSVISADSTPNSLHLSGNISLSYTSPRKAKTHRSHLFSRKEIKEYTESLQPNEHTSSPIQVKKPKLKQLRKKLSRPMRQRSSFNLNDGISPRKEINMRKSKSHHYDLDLDHLPSDVNQNPCSKNKMRELTKDTRLTPDIELFFLQQELPSKFPFTILKHLFTESASVERVRTRLLDKGWKLGVKKPLDCSVPDYYFGRFAYDLWGVFSGAPNGSYITCFKRRRYYVMYKCKSGKILLYPMDIGPKMSVQLSNQLRLTNGIPRPPKRYICFSCSGSDTPCELLNPKGEHCNELMNFVPAMPPKKTKQHKDPRARMLTHSVH